MDSEYFSSINDVSKQLGVPAYTLRYWEKQFPTAIRPTTGAGGRRYYRAETVQKIETIKSLLYTRGLTIAGVKKLLRDGNFPSATESFNITAHPLTEQTAQPVLNSTETNKVEIDTAITLLMGARDLLK